MKYKILLVILAFSALCATAQNRKGDFRLQPGSNKHRLYAAFENDAILTDAAGRALSVGLPGFENLESQYQISLSNALPFTPEKLEQMEKDAVRISGSGASVERLRNILEITIDNPTNERLAELAGKLEALGGVVYCSLVSAEPIRPPGDIAPATPSFEAQQGYIGNSGVKMDYAWNMGLTGQGMNIMDVEYGVNVNHEELNDVQAFIAPWMDVSPEASVSYTEHGTAVFGIMFGHKGNYGISGMAHGANYMALFPEWQSSGYNRIFAVSESVAASVEGDIIVYEMQTNGALGEYGPAEYDNVVWDLTKAATDAGIIVVAAAGNGAEDLDAFEYLPYLNRGDSGAIIVGAGSNNAQHDRLGFSTYGTRVDVHGWGTGVFTSGYGSAGMIGGDFNQGYTWFSGTSSATPIVASCVAVLQSYYFSITGDYMTGQEMRALLQETGTPQGFGNWGNIGPLPNMENAVNKLTNEFLAVKNAERLDFAVYPNPVQDKLTIVAPTLSGTAKTEVYNSIGQVIYTAGVPDAGEIDFSRLSSGIYFVKITDGGKSVSKKVVKN